MSKALGAIGLIFLISVIVPNSQGVLLNDFIDGSVIGYVFTSFNGYGDVNLKVVSQQAAYLAQRKVKNIHILGFYGEFPTLSLASRKALTLAWVKETIRLKLKLIVEIGGMPFPDQLEMAKFCSQLNVSAISVAPILVYEAKTEEELVEDYQRISDAAPNLPLMYRAISETQPDISPAKAFVTLMGRVKTFAGAAVSYDSALDIKAAVPSINGYQIWVFGYKTIASTLITNRNASVTNAINLCPKLIIYMETLMKAGKVRKILDLQEQYELLIQAILSNKGKIIVYNSRTFMKYMRAASEILSSIKLGARLPLEKATETEFDTIRSNLVKFKDFINFYCN